MKPRSSHLLLLLLPLALSACRSAAPDIVSGGGDAGANENWLCEAATGDGWACRQAPAGTARRVRPAVAAPTPATPAPRPPQPPARPVSAPRPPPEAPADEARSVEVEPLPAATPAPLPTDALAGVPATHYAIQLIALNSSSALRKFVAERQLSGTTQVRVESDGRVLFALLAGTYPTREAAARAMVEMGPEALALNPWLRTVGDLRAAIARADQRAGAESP